MKNIQKGFFILSSMMIFILLCINYLSAYQFVCLTNGQSIFVSPTFNYTCNHTICHLCATDDFQYAPGPFCINLVDKSCHPLILDQDHDGVPDSQDKCPDTIGLQIIYGCSCKQILALKPGNNEGELKNGCSKGTIDVFTKQIGWAKNLFN